VIRKRQSQPVTKQNAKPPYYPDVAEDESKPIITREFAVKNPESMRRLETLNLTTKMDTLRNSKEAYRETL